MKKNYDFRAKQYTASLIGIAVSSVLLTIGALVGLTRWYNRDPNFKKFHENNYKNYDKNLKTISKYYEKVKRIKEKKSKKLSRKHKQ